MSGPQLTSPEPRHGPLASMALIPVSEEEVARTIQQFQPKKSNDINATSIWLIKKCSRHLVRPLTKLVNSSFEEGCFPSPLKIAKVTPIFKKGDSSSVDNYRPISILPALSKIFEKLFLVRMTNFLERYNLLSDNQFGFRKGKSTTDAVVSLVDMVVEGLEAKKPTLGVFLDLSKAFDCVDHGLLLQRLESHGIRGLPLQWLTSFMCGRSQVVQISGSASSSKLMNYGVPQGSILSPLLFLMYVNDIGSSIQHGRLVKYADDTTFCISQNTKTELEIKTFQELNTCLQNFNEINLQANSSKSNCINFCLRPTEILCGPLVMLEDSLLEEVHSTKFLGIHLDRGLTWSSHVEVLCSKLSSGIFALRNLSKYCQTQVLMTTYYGLIHPHLLFGIVLWGGCTNTDFTRLFKLQKKAVRIIGKLKTRESCKPAFKELQLLTLPCLYILETATYCLSKCALTRGLDIHNHNTRGRANLRTGQHRTATYEHLPSQAGVHFINKLPDSFKNTLRPIQLKTKLKRFLISNSFYSVGEYLAFNWETANL